MVNTVTFLPRVSVLLIIAQYTAAMFTERSSGARNALRKMVRNDDDTYDNYDNDDDFILTLPDPTCSTVCTGRARLLPVSCILHRVRGRVHTHVSDIVRAVGVPRSQPESRHQFRPLVDWLDHILCILLGTRLLV